eukprot:6344443-Pyramimonas_sp.AAC.1
MGTPGIRADFFVSPWRAFEGCCRPRCQWSRSAACRRSARATTRMCGAARTGAARKRRLPAGGYN